jgi:hypothetical protein
LVGRAASLIEDAPILPPADVTKRAKDLAAPLGVAVEKLTDNEKRNGISKWKEWLNDAKDKGLRRAHKYAKMPVKWTNVEVECEDGVMRADPIALLEKTREKLKKLWKADDDATGNCATQNGINDDGNNEVLPKLTELSADELRNAAKSFSGSTASSFDGIHPRHGDAMSDEGLGALSAFLSLCEATGRWPNGINAVVSAQIPKPTGAPARSACSLVGIGCGQERGDRWRRNGNAKTMSRFSHRRLGRVPSTRPGGKRSGRNEQSMQIRRRRRSLWT